MKKPVYHYLLSSYFIVLILLSFVSCVNNYDNDTPSMEEKPDGTRILPKAYVSHVTHGSIISTSPISINFSIDIEHITEGGDIINEDIFKFYPSVDGKVYWNSSSSLLFIPDKPFERGQKYNVRVDLGKLFEMRDKQDNIFKFNFQVLPLSLTISGGELQTYNNKDRKYNYMDVRVTTSQPVDNENLEQLIEANQGNKKLEVTLLDTTNISDSRIFRVGEIERKEQESSFTISWDGKVIGSNDIGKRIFNIPPLNLFEFTSLKVINTPDQYIEIAFSDPVSTSLNLDGFVYLSNNVNVKYELESNRILMYPTTYQTGDAVVIISKELKNDEGVSLKADLQKKVHFGQIPPAVKFIDDGVILPGKSSWMTHFSAVNLSKVDIFIYEIFANNVKQYLQLNNLDGSYELNRVSKLVIHEQLDLTSLNFEEDGSWKNYAVDLSSMIKDHKNGIYRVQIKYKKEYSMFDCQDEDVQNENNGISNDNYYNNEYYYPYGYNWNYRNNPCSNSYYYYDRFIEKNVLASNIGLIAKKNNNGYTVFATDLRTADIIEGLKISVLDFQKQTLQEVITNSAGIAQISDNKDLWMIVGQREKEFGYLKIKGTASLSYSRFDTKGVNPSNGINGFIYGDRGVWRPGDTLFLTLIAMDINGKLPEKHPASLKLFNPKGKLIVEKTLATSMNGFYSFKPVTSPDDLSGVWRAEITVGGSHFSKRIRIENLKPNRLKILLDFKANELISGKNDASLKVNWLHGGKASGLRAEIDATLRTASTTFSKFPDYNFTDIGKYYAPNEVKVLDKDLNENGEIDFSIDLPESKRAPGKLKVSFVTRVFEKGGDFSISQDNIIYSPFKSYVGLELPKGENGSSYLVVDKPHRFNVATVDEHGTPISVSDLDVEIYKMDWSWWYGYNNHYNINYQRSDFSSLVSKQSINTKDGEGWFDFEISYPMWGYYYVKVTDPNSRHSCGSKFYMDWPSWYSRDNRSTPGSASQLSLSTNKEKYSVGDTVRISFPSPPNSNILVSLESNNKILSTWWTKSKSEESLIEFVADKGMTPNIYASISLIQPYGVNDNDLPARMYGVIPVMVEDPETVLYPDLQLPEEIRPNSLYSINVSEKNNRKMTYTIAVVDEGLLDLTKFKTPDPHSLFYAKQALNVRTWDLYDYVVTGFKGNLSGTFAIGGGISEEDDKPSKKKANRFKPVVQFLGPYTLEAGSNDTHKVLMSNYVGSVKIMLVAGNDGAFGHKTVTVPVKQPLMVLATMPRVLAPSEKIKLPVSVFSMDKNIEEVIIEISSNENFKISITKQKVSFNGPGEKTIYFDVKVEDIEGIGKLRVDANSGNENAYYDVEIDIRNPNPRMYYVKNLLLKKGGKIIHSPEYKGVAGSYELSFSVSSMPQINLEKRLNYLIRYPYHCIEQTTSAAFPQLFLDEMVELSGRQKKKVETHISSALSRISKMQLLNGGFSYWPGNTRISDWGTTYAGHFLLKAKEKGYSISPSVLNKWKEYQKRVSESWRPQYYNNGMINNDLTQSYRLYSLAMAGSPNLGAMNKMREMEGLHFIAKYQLSAAYSLVGQKSAAKKLIESATYVEPVRSYYHSSYGSEIRDKAMSVKPLYLIQDNDAIPIVQDVASVLRSDAWMSTQTTAFSLLAISVYTDNNDRTDAYSFRYNWGSWSDNIIPVKPIFETDLSVDEGDKLIIENTSNTDAFVTVTTSGIPELGSIMSEEKNLELSVVYKSMDGNIINIKNIKHGTDFYAEIVVTNPGKYGILRNMALSQIFPSGWEIINTRAFDMGAELKSSHADYIDFRDDRVNFFFGLNKGETKKYIVLLNAAYIGDYFLPATKCDDMYNNNVSAIIGGGWVTVEK